MDGLTSPQADHSEFIEVDPTGRYGRYAEILGKGASKTVYRAFDEYQGIEVAWNQVKLYDFLQTPEELERLYCEIHLLKTLKHKNIMKFYTSWVDNSNRNINFVTEMFTSGTLRQYRLKHKRVNIRAVKHWCRQILEGLLYLHSHGPPVIHRDLKCDNIFVNGNQGEVKIGDLGLAAILRKAHAVCCVGTPEFMAPEVYEEEYNELVDIYSFGMCILEMVTFEYPYSECTHAAQIYKKVVSGKKPEALYKVKDPEVREFVEKCLVAVSSRLPAWELLKDPFLQIDDRNEFDSRPIDYYQNYDDIFSYLRQPVYSIHHEDASLIDGYTSDFGHDPNKNSDYRSFEYEGSYGSSFTNQGELADDVDLLIKGRRQDGEGIFLRLRIADREGLIRNIYFPFDIQTDSAPSVAAEMVAELDITDHDAKKIADMIDGELATLVPEWKRSSSIEESFDSTNASFCHHCTSYGSLVPHLPSNSSEAGNVQVLSCSNDELATIHGRFEEILYQVEGIEDNVIECKQDESNTSTGINYSDIWAQRERPELSSNEFGESHCNKALKTLEKPEFQEEERITNRDNHYKGRTRNSTGSNHFAAHAPFDDNENDIRQELRWLKAKFKMQLRELRDQKLEIIPKPARKKIDINSLYSVSDQPKEENIIYEGVNSENQPSKPYSSRKIMRVESFCTGALPPQPLHRATSLPVDAVNV